MAKKKKGILQYFSLENKIAIITGASYGLGKAMAVGLAEAGADIVVISRRLENLTDVKREIESLKRKVFPLECDVTKVSQIKNVVDETIRTFGRIDILVNNAGITIRNESINYSEDDWDRVVDVNLKGVFLFCREVGKVMLKQKKGKIINIASLMSFVGGITIPAYSASKGGVAQLTKALSNEWAQHGVNVNAIAPGYFKTPLTKALLENPQRYNEITSRIPMQRWGEPEDLKGAVVFLASEASNYLSGHILTVDGGWIGR